MGEKGGGQADGGESEVGVNRDEGEGTGYTGGGLGEK